MTDPSGASSVLACYHCQALAAEAAPTCPACQAPLILQQRYRLAEVLGRGGFGMVYRAIDLRLRRPCAIKLVSATSLSEQRQVASEANILAHNATLLPFIPQIYTIWSEGTQTYLVMELIEGRTLDQLERLPWSPDSVRACLETLLEQLARLHEAGIVHRDLKPKNIMQTSDERYMLLDFGIAKQGDATLSLARGSFSLHYAAPEQMLGRATDARSDLYSLAATLYHLLVGRPPTPAEARLSQGSLLVPPGDLVAGVDPRLESLLCWMLALDPAERPRDARQALAALRRQQPPAETEPPVSPDPAPLPASRRAAPYQRPPPAARQASLTRPVAPSRRWPLLAGGVLLGTLLLLLVVELLSLFARPQSFLPPAATATPAVVPSATTPRALAAGDQATLLPPLHRQLWTTPTSDQLVSERPRLYPGALVELLALREQAVQVRTPEGVEGWILEPAAQALTSDLATAGEHLAFVQGARVEVVWQRKIPLRNQPFSKANQIVLLDPGTQGRVEELRGDWLRLTLDDGTSGWARWYYNDQRYLALAP